MPIDWKSLPSLSSLRAFELVAEGGSFAAAARILNVTHAAIAQRVRALEADLGVALARRSGRSVALTTEGAMLARGLSEGFGAVAEAVEAVRARQSERPVQMGATVFIAQSIILPRLHEFWALHPEIKVSVAPSQDLLDIAEMGYDLAIRATETEPDWPDMNVELLARCDVIAVGAPSMVNDDMPPLDQLPWVWTAGVGYEERAIRSFGLDPKMLTNVDMGVPSLQLQLARQGLGLLAATELIVRQDLAIGQLRRVAARSSMAVSYHVVTPKGPVRPAAAEFIAWLKDVARELPAPAG